MTLDMMGLSTFNLIAGKMLPSVSLSGAGDIWLESIAKQTTTAATFGLLTLRDYDNPAQRLAVGWLWQRMHLWLTDQGWAAQPMNQYLYWAFTASSIASGQLPVSPRWNLVLYEPWFLIEGILFGLVGWYYLTQPRQRPIWLVLCVIGVGLVTGLLGVQFA